MLHMSRAQRLRSDERAQLDPSLEVVSIHFTITRKHVRNDIQLSIHEVILFPTITPKHVPSTNTKRTNKQQLLPSATECKTRIT